MEPNTDVLDQGIASVGDDGKELEQERADTKLWLERVKDARTFDKNARQRYAKDRKYARGDKGEFEVGLSIAGTYIEIEKGILYAKDPDLDCQPADSTRPPPMADILRMAKQQVVNDPATVQALAQAQATAVQTAQADQAKAAAGAAVAIGTGDKSAMPPAMPVDPAQASQAAVMQTLQQLVQAKAHQLLQPYLQRQSDARQFAQTISCVVPSLWRKARLKKRAKRLVGSGQTVGVGWLKVTWQEQTETDPEMQSQLSSMQDNIKRLAEAKIEAADNADACADYDAQIAEIKQLEAGIRAKVEVVVARGLGIDFVAAEDIQVAPSVPFLTDYVDSPWISHRIFMSMDDAKIKFPDIATKDADGCCPLDKATKYYARKPSSDTDRKDVGSIANTTDADADRYDSSNSMTLNTKDAGEASVCAEEVWYKDANQIITLVHGVDRYAKQPYAPNPGTERFYGFFLYAPIEVDGERHPQSKIERTESLLDDMNRLYSNRAKHRRRAIPKTAFNATGLDPKEADKISAADTAETIPIHPTDPSADVSKLIAPIAYNNIDAALYDDSQQRAMLEMMWGIQEALASTIQTAKTATEAEIQDKGTDTRTNYERDSLDDLFDELAEYTTQIAVQKLTIEDARAMAGPWAFWPQIESIEDLSQLVIVKIKGGSSGKPDTSAQKEQWANTLPIMQNAITQIGQLRGATPESIADGLEELVKETLDRAGDGMDPDRFLPSAPDNSGMPGAPAPAIPPPVPTPNTIVPQGATLQ